jgi:hypothetical protein
MAGLEIRSCLASLTFSTLDEQNAEISNAQAGDKSGSREPPAARRC